MKTKLTATTPRGTFTRTTERHYTHMNVFRFPHIDNNWHNGSWSGSLELAHKAAEYSRRCNSDRVIEIEIYPVDGV